MENKKVVIAKAKNSEDYNRLCSIANRYRETSSIKEYAGVECDATFFPNDEYDLLHITEMLEEKGFGFRVEEAR